jgi:hypothetical protein
MSGVCQPALSQRSDLVDSRLDYVYSTNLATALFFAWVGNLTYGSDCYNKAFYFACNAAYPTCSFFDQCKDSYQAAVAACTGPSRTLPRGFNTSMCFHVPYEPHRPDYVVIIISSAVMFVVIILLVIAYITYLRSRINAVENLRYDAVATVESDAAPAQA